MTASLNTGCSPDIGLRLSTERKNIRRSHPNGWGRGRDPIGRPAPAASAPALLRHRLFVAGAEAVMAGLYSSPLLRAPDPHAPTAVQSPAYGSAAVAVLLSI